MTRSIIAAMLALVLIANAGCATKSRSAGPDATPSAAYTDLAARSAHATFSVLFDANWEGRKGILLWRKSGPFERWDLFEADLHNTYALNTVLRKNAQPAGGCAVYLDSPSKAEAICTAGTVGINPTEVLSDPFVWVGQEMKPSAVLTIAGESANCYAAALPPITSIAMCLSNDGIPLSVDSSFTNSGPVHLYALDVSRDVPSPFNRLPVDPQRVAGLSPVPVAIDQLDLPPIPQLLSYLGHTQ